MWETLNQFEYVTHGLGPGSSLLHSHLLAVTLCPFLRWFLFLLHIKRVADPVCIMMQNILEVGEKVVIANVLDVVAG